jgi:hypothetical protein
MEQTALSVPDCSAWKGEEQGARGKSPTPYKKREHEEIGSQKNFGYATKMLLTDPRSSMLSLNNEFE